MTVSPVETTSLDLLEEIDLELQCEWPLDVERTRRCPEKADWVITTKMPCCGHIENKLTCTMHKDLILSELNFSTVGICYHCNESIIVSFSRVLIKIEKI